MESTTMYIAKIYLILLSTLIHIAGCIDDKFWLTTELMRFEWSRGCTATKYCTRPQLRLTEQNLINGETLAVNWLFSEDVVTDHARPFVTYWNRGSPSDISIATEIIGFDPKYRFQRVCDLTGAKRIFLPSDNQNHIVDVGRARSIKSSGKRIIVELKGRCFEASLAVQSHLEECPWCTTDAPTTSKTPDQTASEFLKDQPAEFPLLPYFTDKQTLLILLVSVTTAVFACVGFISVLCAFCRLRTETHKSCKEKVFTLLPVSFSGEPGHLSRNRNFRKHQETKRRCLPILHWDSDSTTQTLSTSEEGSVDTLKLLKQKTYLNSRQVSDATVYENVDSVDDLHRQSFEVVPFAV
ncbi:unnamed protein product [Enterobius vermicularis]|uniref:Ig-like domain-containing protein n=1 Tax=Enterobius vermicularis TaxID=51028 RepID=A0A0N4VC17_ENTVE|nr:unnamed protein product [Enterobius vermicularis]